MEREKIYIEDCTITNRDGIIDRVYKCTAGEFMIYNVLSCLIEQQAETIHLLRVGLGIESMTPQETEQFRKHNPPIVGISSIIPRGHG